MCNNRARCIARGCSRLVNLVKQLPNDLDSTNATFIFKSTRPDKGNGVVVLDEVTYDNAISDLLSDDTKFKKWQSDLTLRREGQLQRYLRKLKKSSAFDSVTCCDIYPPVLNQLG